jgi:rubredoxin
MENWTETNHIKCPECGAYEVEYEDSVCLTSLPAQFRARCKVCKKVFYTSAVHQIKNVPAYPANTELNKGWICPVCGRGVAPHVQVCPCVTGNQDFVWCNNGSINIT